MNKSGPKPRTHCKNGHEMTPENTYQVYRNGVKNGLMCKTCQPLAGSGKRGPNKRKFCKYGHELTVENTYQCLEKNGSIKDGRKCKLCACRLSSSHRKRFPDKHYKFGIESQMRLKYGIDSIAARDAILASQGGACAICGCTDCTWGKGYNKKWHTDHAHNGTVNYRGILCSNCNLALGQLEGHIDQVVKYLSKFTVVLNKGEDDEKVDEKSVAWGCGFALGYS